MHAYPDGDDLTTPLGRAQARKEPVDADRLQAFEVLANYLVRCSLLSSRFVESLSRPRTESESTLC